MNFKHTAEHFTRDHLLINNLRCFSDVEETCGYMEEAHHASFMNGRSDSDFTSLKGMRETNALGVRANMRKYTTNYAVQALRC